MRMPAGSCTPSTAYRAETARDPDDHHVDAGARQINTRVAAPAGPPPTIMTWRGDYRTALTGLTARSARTPWEAKYSVSRLTRYENSKVPELGGEIRDANRTV